MELMSLSDRFRHHADGSIEPLTSIFAATADPQRVAAFETSKDVQPTINTLPKFDM